MRSQVFRAVDASGQGGLLDVVLSPAFEKDRLILSRHTGESRYPERAYAIRPYKNSGFRVTLPRTLGLPGMTFE
jgi:hypothetical protein